MSNIYFGDLHASSLKLLLEIKEYGYLKNLDDHYDNLAQAYENNDIEAFFTAFKELKFELPEGADGKFICHLGDILSDRGPNDLYSLFIIHQLDQLGIDFDIIYSNHDAEFIRNIKNIKDGNYEITVDIGSDEEEAKYYCQSLYNFIEFLKNDDKERDETDPLNKLNINKYIDSYLKHLQVCRLDEINDTYVLATHAPLNHEAVEKHFVKEGASLSDAVNDTKSQFRTLIENEEYEKTYDTYHDLVWTRNDQIRPDFNLKNLLNTEGKAILNPYGHDGSGQTLYGYEGSINLDNENAKGKNQSAKYTLPNVGELSKESIELTEDNIKEVVQMNAQAFIPKHHANTIAQFLNNEKKVEISGLNNHLIRTFEFNILESLSNMISSESDSNTDFIIEHCYYLSTNSSIQIKVDQHQYEYIIYLCDIFHEKNISVSQQFFANISIEIIELLMTDCKKTYFADLIGLVDNHTQNHGHLETNDYFSFCDTFNFKPNTQVLYPFREQESNSQKFTNSRSKIAEGFYDFLVEEGNCGFGFGEQDASQILSHLGDDLLKVINADLAPNKSVYNDLFILLRDTIFPLAMKADISIEDYKRFKEDMLSNSSKMLFMDNSDNESDDKPNLCNES